MAPHIDKYSRADLRLKQLIARLLKRKLRETVAESNRQQRQKPVDSAKKAR